MNENEVQPQGQDRIREFLCIVYGNVQGVSFRKFAKEKADELGIAGTTANLPDGTVEVVAQGRESIVRKFLDFMYSGSDEAEVESVNVQWGPVTEPMVGFKIL